MGLDPFNVVRFHLGPLLQGQMRIAKLKSAYISLTIGSRVLRCQANLQVIMGWASSDVVRFDLECHTQGQTRIVTLKSAYNLLISSPEGFGCETNQ